MARFIRVHTYTGHRPLFVNMSLVIEVRKFTHDKEGSVMIFLNGDQHEIKETLAEIEGLLK